MTRRGLILFAALGIIWGIPYLFIKLAIEQFSPEFLVVARTALAALVLLPIAFRRGAILPVLKRWPLLLAFMASEVVLPWYFLNSAEQHLPSSTTGLLLSAVPLVAVGLALVMGSRDRLTALNWLGVGIGMLGVAAIVGLDLAGTNLIGVAQLGVVVLGYAIGPIILSRWMSDLPGVGVIALAMAGSALVTLPVVGITGGWPTEVPHVSTIVAVVVLGVICSALAFVVMFALVDEIGPIRMTAVTYVNPAVAVIAGALVLGEAITVWTVVGFALILLGSALVTRPRKAAPALVE